MVVTGSALGLTDVALFLELCEHIKVDVEHVIDGPHLTAVGIGVFVVVAAVWREHQRNLVFVVVVLIVAAQTYEHGKLIVLQVGDIGHEMIGMDEHLHVLVLTEIERGLLIDGLRLSMLHVPHHHVQCLFVVLHKLWLRGVGGTADARRQHVIDGNLIVVLFNVHGTHHEFSRFRRRGVQTLFVNAPLSTHKVEASETQYDRLLETCHEHSHETHAREVVDGTHPPDVLREGDAELVPVDACGVAVAQFHTAGAHVGDETIGRSCTVAVGIKNLWRDAHLVLEVALILVEGEVLVDIFHVGAALITGVIRLRLLVGVRGVPLGVVDALVAVEDALALVVEVGTTEVVVVVAGRVFAPGLYDAVVGDDTTVHHGVEPILISPVLTFLLVVESVEAHILLPA